MTAQITLQQKTWQIQLELIETNRYSYQFWDFAYNSSEPIFQGNDFVASPLHKSLFECAACCLSFFCLQEGEVEDFYFNSYSFEQLKWRDTRASLVQEWQIDLENLAAIAGTLYQLSEDSQGYIVWEKWMKEDKPAFPIRLRYYHEEYFLHTGNSSFDLIHKGAWGSGMLSPQMSHQDVWDELFSMMLQCQEALF